ncbi:MAG: saccharopine dehydrogenase NADP-binding domain-containing protein [Oligoflexia bacterium]|nr:saccharopine dehydrogenase NADP-binding domain-containing protein [Oligoflexia bacterium]
MHKIALFGAGKIGEAITGLLTKSGRYQVRVADLSLERAKIVAEMWPGTEAVALKLEDEKSTKNVLSGCEAVLSALPYYCNPRVAELAIQNGLHYFDLTEDVETTDKVSKLGRDASICVMPQCGLAPGFVSVAATFLANTFESVDSIKMRVGALPIYPSNQLKYNLTWSTEGLINEYGNICEVVHRGKRRNAFALEGYERFSLDGDEYEAFNTSGGLGTLCDTMEGKVRTLDYKSIRYPGHRDLIAFLMNELRFNEDRETLKTVFERSISTTAQDKCLIFVEARGHVKKRFVQRTYASTVYNTVIDGKHFSAIQLTTASGICTPLDMVLTGKLSKRKGFVKCEDISLLDFLDNEFGRHYKDEKALKGIAV